MTNEECQMENTNVLCLGGLVLLSRNEYKGQMIIKVDASGIITFFAFKDQDD